MSASETDWFQLAPCGLVATTQDGTIVEANDTFLEWTAYERADVVGRTFVMLLEPGSRLFFETRHRQVLHLRGAFHEVALTLRRADGEELPVLVNATRDSDDGGVVRFAIFNATERVRYERDILAARRAAEQSERRVRVLQEVSTMFGLSATDEEVAQSFSAVARDAFSARETAVLMTQDDGRLLLTGGSNPLEDKVAPVPELRGTAEVTVVHDDDTAFPELSAAMRDNGLASLSVTPLIADGERLGVLACFFAGRVDVDDHFIDLQQALGRQASQTLVRVRLQRRLALLALHDQLTGVANRQLLQMSLDDALTLAEASLEPLAVLFLDVDDFKAINDTFGHAAGDSVLVELASRLHSGVRAGDIVGRMGGDEFVALCPGADSSAAENIAQRILEVCREPIAVADGVVVASVSVGISLFRPGVDPQPSAQQLLVRADAAMYDAKRAGKDRSQLSIA
ncbi:GGDEF domain-containing protein [Microbacterium kyungheense]|uniref:PAS domain S-box-containing protein/diguanylate cyclase (GGDEF)-like protein n=1 Tax=Microbacterium kyungheense TaxID=1263636 RepID=A0A543EE03_9MICO|nr:diguanylate cyclase [Microbacterium kyungheense]TQM19828.1 PAS domain S-box-containing protein/diguanylate cyclase (GGDEF)-like protein [Microbacterium kyungheense]